MLRIERVPATMDGKELRTDHRIYVGGELIFDISEEDGYHVTKWQTNLPDLKAIEETFNMQYDFSMKCPKFYVTPKVSIQVGGNIVINECPLDDFLNQTRETSFSHFLSPTFQLLRLDIQGETAETAFCYDKTLPNTLPYIGTISSFNLSKLLPKWIRGTSANGVFVNEKEVSSALERIYKKYPNP